MLQFARQHIANAVYVDDLSFRVRLTIKLRRTTPPRLELIQCSP